ncbi:hypothetical protein SAMN04515668_3012 [Hymenobacter arizonensis]|uniref:Uncharacterized protein n=1 Tax=Hymenobacter arizonensis TaxID=1227077 RepID=A0A1I5ZLF8_HYMAR|nr:hypothetical protein SAMN04515668_3012 [Hymenobacter arizonensis]
MLSLRSIFSPQNNSLWRDKMLRKLSMTGDWVAIPREMLRCALHDVLQQATRKLK